MATLEERIAWHQKQLTLYTQYSRPWYYHNNIIAELVVEWRKTNTLVGVQLPKIGA